jgi:hypothetical protein
VLPLLRRRDVRADWLRSINAVMVEFPLGVWAVSYLKEVGHASGGLAVALGATWGLFLFLSRMSLPRLVRRAGDAGLAVAYAVAGTGALLMWIGPNLGVRVVALSIAAIGAGPLYPLSVDGLYRHGDARPDRAAIDSGTLGALAALSSGVAISVGPMVLGVLADVVGLRHALLVVPLLAALGVSTSRSVRRAVSALDTGRIAIVAGQ